jgi:hypothetical protein
MKRASRGKLARGHEIRTRIVSQNIVQHGQSVASSRIHDAGFQTAELHGVGRVTRSIFNMGVTE